MSAGSSRCPACGTDVVARQEYCLTCGSRLPGRRRLGPVPSDTRANRTRIGFLGLTAVAGAAVAIGLTYDGADATTIVTATGGSVTLAGPTIAPASRLATWPRGRTAWTIVLLSVPKVEGRDKAVAVAQQARDAGLLRVGVVDSSRFSSLRPGYWMAFTGVYGSEPAAAGGLRRARTVVRSARTQRVVP